MREISLHLSSIPFHKNILLVEFMTANKHRCMRTSITPLQKCHGRTDNVHIIVANHHLDRLPSEETKLAMFDLS